MSTLVWIVLFYPVFALACLILMGKVVKRNRTIWMVGFLAAYLLIPFGDQIAGSLYLKQLCNTQAERKIFKTVDNIPGFLAMGRNIEPSKVKPYQFIENETKDFAVVRLTLESDGRFSREENVKPISRYRYRQGPHPVALGVVRYDQVIEDMKTNDILAIERRFNFGGGWIWRRLFPGTTQSCPGLPQLDIMIPQILKPAPIRNGVGVK